jgi:hypothetical protein
MNSFTYIISSFFPDIDIFRVAFEFPQERNSVINKDFVAYGLLNSLHFGTIKYPQNSKFFVFDASIVGNTFLESSKKEIYMDIFRKTQKIYHGFCRLARFFKIKRAKRFDVDTDLYMNSFVSLGPSLLVDIYDDDSRTMYKFRLTDLMNIANTALSHSPDFFAEPQEIKNPYTNIAFTSAQLYTIYFMTKSSRYIMPILFHQYFISGFDTAEFCKYNECHIREVAMKVFLDSGSEASKYYYITKMLRDYRSDMNNMVIHPQFPATKLLEAFSEYLYDYLLENYSLNPSLRYHSKQKLQTKLTRFSRLNPTYGRKVINNIRNHRRRVPYNFSIDTDTTTAPELNFHFVDDIVVRSPRVTPRQLRARRSRARGGAARLHRPFVTPPLPMTTAASQTGENPETPTTEDEALQGTHHYVVNEEADEAFEIDESSEIETDDDVVDSDALRDIVRHRLRFPPDTDDDADDADDDDADELSLDDARAGLTDGEITRLAAETEWMRLGGSSTVSIAALPGRRGRTPSTLAGAIEDTLSELLVQSVMSDITQTPPQPRPLGLHLDVSPAFNEVVQEFDSGDEIFPSD